ncbi:MAG: hypothetical protein AABY00_02160 [Nanoarchaeota archaeon]
MTNQTTYDPAIIVSAQEVLGDYRAVAFKEKNIGRFIALADGDTVRTYGLLVDKVDLQKRTMERGRFSGVAPFDIESLLAPWPVEDIERAFREIQNPFSSYSLILGTGFLTLHHSTKKMIASCTDFNYGIPQKDLVRTALSEHSQKYSVEIVGSSEALLRKEFYGSERDQRRWYWDHGFEAYIVKNPWMILGNLTKSPEQSIPKEVTLS